MRPRSLDEIRGQRHILGPGKPLTRMIEEDNLASLLLYGPPGTGKTTIMMIAEVTRMEFEKLSAGVKGCGTWRNGPRPPALSEPPHDFVYRRNPSFNKAQQDLLLPFVERGTIILIARRRKTRFPLIKRFVAYENHGLEPLEKEEIRAILDRALMDDAYLSALPLQMEEEAMRILCRLPAATRVQHPVHWVGRAVGPAETGKLSVTAAHAKKPQISSATATTKTATPICFRPLSKACGVQFDAALSIWPV